MEAMRHLALYYEEGSFVEQNLETALLWYQRSAEAGMSFSRANDLLGSSFLYR